MSVDRLLKALSKSSSVRDETLRMSRNLRELFLSPHLFEFQSKEAIGLSADGHAGEVRQRDAGLHLASLLVSQDNVVLGQQEDPSRALLNRRRKR